MSQASCLTPDTAFFSYQDAFRRMLEVSGCHTTAELAKALGVGEELLLDMRRNEAMPYHILGFCLDFFQASPLWIMFGVEPCRLENVDAMELGEKMNRVVQARELMHQAVRV